MASEVARRADDAMRAWLASLSKEERASIPSGPIEREGEDEIRLVKSSPDSPEPRGLVSVWDCLGEYTLRSAGYLPTQEVTAAELTDEGADPIAITDNSSRKKELKRRKRNRTNFTMDSLPELSALQKIPAENQWAGEIVASLLEEKLAHGIKARLPELPATCPVYVSRGVLGWAMRKAAPRGGGKRLGPVRLALVLADPAELANQIDDDLEAKRHVAKFVPTLMDEGVAHCASANKPLPKNR